MTVIKSLVWDEWNRVHIQRHSVTIEEVEEVCRRKYKEIKSYRKRFLLIGKTKTDRILAVVITPEDRNGISYGEGIYYVVTAYEKEGQ
ncbi:BrnT family toxin [Candidatus Gottesmanbacteria bacterium]|nr:BrnT family toxin [Candidatus Gottesmanbacteria bacterium]